MSGIESSVMPFVSTIGFGGIAGFLVGFALKRIMKILAVIAGVFFAALLYLESQHIVNVNWDKLQTISNGILSTITTTVATNTTSTGGGGMGAIQAFLGNNSTGAAKLTFGFLIFGKLSPVSHVPIHIGIIIPWLDEILHT
jgi:uncharacterized membrane protein (Fun14 family)